MEQTKPLYSGMQKGVEKSTKEGESPVLENVKEPRGTLSNTEHVKLRMNLRRPWRKAKY